MITHAIDSTTKRGVGQFAVQGIHIGQDLPFPLPIINICGEKTEDIAHQVKSKILGELNINLVGGINILFDRLNILQASYNIG